MATATAFFAGAVGTGFGAVGFAFNHDGLAEGDNAETVGAGAFHLGNGCHGFFLQMGDTREVCFTSPLIYLNSCSNVN